MGEEYPDINAIAAQAQADSQESSAPEDGAPEQPPDTGPSGEAGGEESSSQPQQESQATPPQGSPDWFKPELFKLKYRGQEVSPKDYNHATELMQKGYSYEQAMAQVNRMKQQIEQQAGRFTQYQQLDEAFRRNPQFAAQIWKMYQDALQQQGQPAQQGQANTPMDPQYQQLFGMVQGMQQKLQTWDQMQADQRVDNEIQTLKGKYSTTQWDARTETGHTLLYDVINHAHQNRFPSLEAAYRDYMFDSVMTNARGQGVEEASKQRQAQSRAGVVGKGSSKPSSKPNQGPDIHNSSYAELEQAALAELGKH